VRTDDRRQKPSNPSFVLATLARSPLQAHKMQMQMQHAEACGALPALSALDRFRRKNCLRVADLFGKMDSDGSGSVDASELRKGLKKCNLFMSKADVKGLVAFLDTGRDGSVEQDEMEFAIKMFRRVSWQKAEIEELLKSVSDIHITDRCKSITEIFGLRPGDEEEEITGQDLADALMRMRGDKDARLWYKMEGGGSAEDDEEEDAIASKKGRTSKDKKSKTTGSMLPQIKGAKKTKKKKKIASNQPSRQKSIANRYANVSASMDLFGAGGEQTSGWVPGYVDRLYDLNQQAAYQALFRMSDSQVQMMKATEEASLPGRNSPPMLFK
jgi:Ca2+-binding EF-hand superfamily protein